MAAKWRERNEKDRYDKMLRLNSCIFALVSGLRSTSLSLGRRNSLGILCNSFIYNLAINSLAKSDAMLRDASNRANRFAIMSWFAIQDNLQFISAPAPAGDHRNRALARPTCESHGLGSRRLRCRRLLMRFSISESAKSVIEIDERSHSTRPLRRSIGRSPNAQKQWTQILVR